MKPTVVEIEPRKKIIQPSSWKKKELADAHLDAVLFCAFACVYCSSNAMMHLRMLKKTLQKAVEKITGKPFNSHDAKHIVIAYREFFSAFEKEMKSGTKRRGKDKTLAFSQLTDGFSPNLLQPENLTRKILELVLEHTSYRIRVLTKNAIIGRPEWIDFFAKNADRFVVGLSIGSLDDDWAKGIERFTSSPRSRIKALHTLQDAGVPTYGMLCPVFPEVLRQGDDLERLADAIRPELCEHIWSEPFNARQNWAYVRACYTPDSQEWKWLTDVYEHGRSELWSGYASELYQRLHRQAVKRGWQDKFRYLLYEGDITQQDAPAFAGLDGVLLQSKSDKQGKSRNPHIAALQA